MPKLVCPREDTKGGWGWQQIRIACILWLLISSIVISHESIIYGLDPMMCGEVLVTENTWFYVHTCMLMLQLQTGHWLFIMHYYHLKKLLAITLYCRIIVIVCWYIIIVWNKYINVVEWIDICVV